MVVQVFVPEGERWNVALATREPPVSAESELTVTVLPLTLAPLAGAVSEPVGSVLSTRTVTVAEVKVLPAASVVMTRRSYCPSGVPLRVFHAMEYGLVIAVPIVVQVFAPIGDRWNAADATPAPPVSAELEVTVTLPLTFAPPTGAVIEPVGFVVS